MAAWPSSVMFSSDCRLGHLEGEVISEGMTGASSLQEQRYNTDKLCNSRALSEDLDLIS